MYRTIVNGKDCGSYQSIEDAMKAGRKIVNESKDGRVDVIFRSDSIPMRTAEKRNGTWKTF
jgi:hypothetical protein